MTHAGDHRWLLRFICRHFILSEVVHKSIFPIPRPDLLTRITFFCLPTDSIANLDRSLAQSFPSHAHFAAIPFCRHQPVCGVGNRNRPIRSRIARNNSRGIATSAIWKITCRAWRRKLPKLYAAMICVSGVLPGHLRFGLRASTQPARRSSGVRRGCCAHRPRV